MAFRWCAIAVVLCACEPPQDNPPTPVGSSSSSGGQVVYDPCNNGTPPTFTLTGEVSVATGPQRVPHAAGDSSVSAFSGDSREFTGRYWDTNRGDGTFRLCTDLSDDALLWVRSWQVNNPGGWYPIKARRDVVAHLDVLQLELENLVPFSGLWALEERGLWMELQDTWTPAAARVTNPDVERERLTIPFMTSTQTALEPLVVLSLTGTWAETTVAIPRSSWPLAAAHAMENPAWWCTTENAAWMLRGTAPLSYADGHVLTQAELAGLDTASTAGPPVGVGSALSGECVLAYEAPATCVCATLHTVGGGGLAGATARLVGGMPADVAMPAALDGSGRVCADTVAQPRMISFDVINGELHWGTAPLQFTPSATGTCVELGTLQLETRAPRRASVVTLAGHVLKADGTPVPGATVDAADPTLPASVFAQACGSSCGAHAVTDSAGAFVLHVATRGEVELRTTLTEGGATWWGGAFITDPAAMATVVIHPAGAHAVLSVATVGTSVTWDPPLGLRDLSVQRDDGVELWRVKARGNVFPPVELGVAPAGASEASVPSPQLGSWSRVVVQATGARDGFLVAAEGTGQHP